jgi:hypothetical protein
MTTAKCLRRQAATCAALADATYDEESRERYLRLEQLYLALAESEDPTGLKAAPFASDSATEPATPQLN